MSSIEKSTIDLEQMDRDERLYNAIDHLGGIRLPIHFEVACFELDLATPGMATVMRAAVDADDTFSEVEKKAYKYDIVKRIQIANIAAAPEGWNC